MEHLIHRLIERIEHMAEQLDAALAALKTAADNYIITSQAKDRTIAHQQEQIAVLQAQLTAPPDESAAVAAVNAVTTELGGTPPA